MEYIPFEKPLADLEVEIGALRHMAATQALDLHKEIQVLEKKAEGLLTSMFAQLTPYETVQISRHPRRPNTLEWIDLMCEEFIELHGDRNFFDDKSIVGGLARIAGNAVVIIGHQKGRGTKGNIERNFGMPMPEGYRKALRLMSMAERFKLPVITLIDTPGAYPGIGAEERGQSEAIAKNIMVMSSLKTPIITIVTGEGGSGGALALGVGSRVYMLQYAIYSVISPEGCASILLKNAREADKMADALKLTAKSAKELGVIDGVLPEPLGGAHRNPKAMAETIKAKILEDIAVLSKMDRMALREERRQKYLAMGQHTIQEN